MTKRTLRLMICLILVLVSVLFAIYCVINSDQRLYLSVISVAGTTAILVQEMRNRYAYTSRTISGGQTRLFTRPLYRQTENPLVIRQDSGGQMEVLAYESENRYLKKWLGLSKNCFVTL